MALLNIGAEQANKILTDETACNDFIDKAGALLKPSSSESSSYKEMTDFRANFKELFKAAHIEKLVVLIDDLDRCLPKVAIETLEAVRMFLSTENTAFIIAADDAMIRYSVKEHFPRVLEQDFEDTSRTIDYNRFSDKYLEKLIQVPMHIPRLGIAEAQMYVLLLMIESQIGETEELKKLAEKAIKKQNKPWALEPITTQEIQNVLGDTYDSVTENVMIAKSIDKILAQNTGGNPRNIKRFVNMLLLRTMVAHNRGFDENGLAMPVLAKMMLAEQYNYDFYKAIAAELREDGTCQAFDAVPEPEDQEETSNEITESEGADKGKSKAKTSKEKTAPPEHKYKNDKFADKLKDEAIKTWVSIEPSLAGVDLRPYFFACTEQEDFFTEYHASQIELLKMLGANSANEHISFSTKKMVKTIGGNKTVQQYISMKRNHAADLFAREGFPKNIEQLKTAMGVLFNYWGLRSICYMYCKDYMEETDNGVFLRYISADLFQAMNKLMVGWLPDILVDISCKGYWNMIIPLIQQYKLA